MIEERSVRRLDSTRSEPIDAGITAAASVDLATIATVARFGRTLPPPGVVSLVLPPLRTRGEGVAESVETL